MHFTCLYALNMLLFKKCRGWDLNPRHHGLQPCTLPTELPRQKGIIIISFYSSVFLSSSAVLLIFTRVFLS